MKSYTFDQLCASQEFNHDEKFYLAEDAVTLIREKETELQDALDEVYRLNNLLCAPQGYDFYDDKTESILVNRDRK